MPYCIRKRAKRGEMAEWVGGWEVGWLAGLEFCVGSHTFGHTHTHTRARMQGFVDVDKCTTQHHAFPNIFALGDASSLPTSKTMAAITGQAPVLTHNLLRVMAGKRASAQVRVSVCLCLGV